jgi:hypothetical protein
MRRNTSKQANTTALASAVLILTLACAPAQPKNEPLPAGDPSVAGQITAASPTSMQVEENPADSSGSAKAVVHITDDTKILLRDGTRLNASDLQVGRRARVWFIGPVLESYPVQATAEFVVLENDSG